MLAFLLAVMWAVQGPEATAVRAVLDVQAAAWNRGDIEAFMTTYADSPELTFQGKDGVTRGYRPVLERYRTRYGTREAMGQLRFTDVEVRLIEGGVAVVLGRFELERSAAGGGPASGRFTLVLQKLGGHWKIVHDHTS